MVWAKIASSLREWLRKFLRYDLINGKETAPSGCIVDDCQTQPKRLEETERHFKDRPAIGTIQYNDDIEGEEDLSEIGHRHISQEALEEQIRRKIKQIRPVARYMASTEDIVEERIRKAMERGEFNNLKGKGKPLDLREKPFEDPDMRIAYKILNNAGFSPYWVAIGKEIDAEISGCWQLVEQFVVFVERMRREERLNSRLITIRREEVLEICSKKLAKANKKIENYNFIVPMYWLQRKKIDEEKEMARIREKIDTAVRGY